MEKSVIERVEEYVRTKYKSYAEIKLTIREGENCFYVYKHIDGSPLILGKSIIN